MGAALGLLMLVTPASAGARPRDRDRDGLRDRVEVKRYKTNPRKRDTDRDGLKDGAEVKRFKTNPRRKDTDRDGLRDGAEVKRFKTKPRRKDTDRDGLKDGAEVKRYRTNPRKRDTDDDGLKDGAEVRRFKTNPRKRDTDGDGIPDGVEVLRGTNPLAPPSPGIPSTPLPSGPPVRPCGSVTTSLAGLQGAVAAAAPGAVICLANGSYGSLTLQGPGTGDVVVQSEHPGGATVGELTLRGSRLTVASLNVSNGVTIQPNAAQITVEYNRISGGGQGLDMATSTTPITDLTVRGNKFVGPFGEDAIRLNGYRDGGDADNIGVLIEGNEISGVRENGSHSDCLQAVWGGDSIVYRGNYVHDNRCQGFFVKDQQSAISSVVVEDNLFVRNNMACAPSAPGCGQPVSFQVFGPINSFLARRNTVWGYTGDMVTLRGSGWGRVDVTDNVAYKFWSDTSSPFGNYGAGNDVGCDTNRGSFPATGIARNCSPGFANPGADDYRVPGGQGVSWAAGARHFGP